MRVGRNPSIFFFVVVVLVLISLTLAANYSDTNSVGAVGLQIIEVQSVEVNPVFDTYISELQPDASWPDENALWIGMNLTANQNMGIRRSLLKFDLSVIPAGSTIQSASFEMQVGATTSEDAEMNAYVSRLKGEWPTEGITWNQAQNLSVDPEHISMTYVSSNLGSISSWDMTGMLAKWIGFRPGNSELLVQVRGYEQRDRQRERAFLAADCTAGVACGAKPVLKISYIVPTATPTATATNTATPTFTPTPTPTATPLPHAGVSISVEPIIANSEVFTLYGGSLVTYTVSIQDANAVLSNVILRADALIETGLVPTHDMEPVSISHGGNVISDSNGKKEVVWNIGSLNPNEVISRTYTVQVGFVQCRTLCFPGYYMLNDGATLTWTYPGGSGEARTRPLRNPPFYETLMPLIQHYRAEFQ